MSDILDLKGAVALITGAGQNAGREIALQFAAHGAGAIVVNDFYLERAEAVAREIDDRGGVALAVQGDVSSGASVKAMFATAVERFGRG